MKETRRERLKVRTGCCCCCSTQRAQPPDPQAREPLSLGAHWRVFVQHNAHARAHRPQVESSQVKSRIDPKHGGRYRDGRRHGRHCLLYTKFAAAGRQLPRQRSTKMLRCSVQPQRPSFEVGF